MLKIEAVSRGGGIDVSTKAEGMSTDLLEEATAIIESIYEDLVLPNEGMSAPFLFVLGSLVADWIDEMNKAKGSAYA